MTHPFGVWASYPRAYRGTSRRPTAGAPVPNPHWREESAKYETASQKMRGMGWNGGDDYDD